MGFIALNLWGVWLCFLVDGAANSASHFFGHYELKRNYIKFCKSNSSSTGEELVSPPVFGVLFVPARAKAGSPQPSQYIIDLASGGRNLKPTENEGNVFGTP